MLVHTHTHTHYVFISYAVCVNKMFSSDPNFNGNLCGKNFENDNEIKTPTEEGQAKLLYPKTIADSISRKEWFRFRTLTPDADEFPTKIPTLFAEMIFNLKLTDL